MQVSTDGRIRVCYTLTSDGGESAESRARQIALEQTVELPEGCYPREIEREVVGRVEAVEQRSAARSVVTVSYPVVLLENTIYTISLTNKVSGFEWQGEVDAQGVVTEQ